MNKVRYNFFLFVISLALLSVLIKAYNVAVIKHTYYSKLYINNITKTIYKKGKRGCIYSEKNKNLAIDYPSYDLFVDPKYYLENKKNNGEDYTKSVERFIDKISTAVNIKPEYIKKVIEDNKSSRFVLIKRDIPPNVFQNISESFMPRSFGFIKKYKRYYPDGEYSAHNIGFCFKNGVGAEGLERYYEQYLKPEIIKGDVPLDLYRYRFAPIPKNGDDLYISINKDIQDYVHIKLKEAVEKHDADGGMVVVLNPYDGSVVAMDSYPFYDNNQYRKYDYTSIKNRAVANVFEPGSVFKLITLSAALDSSAFKENEIIYCEGGSWKLKNKTIHDVHKFGWLGFRDVFINSSNIGSAKIALSMGKKLFYQYLSKFGFGKKTGIDTISESKGIVKDIFSIGDVDLATMAFGQGISVTAIQLAKSYAVIANGGYAVRPHFLEYIKDKNGVVYKYKIDKKRILKKESVAEIKGILEDVITKGTGKRAYIEGYTTAGKTGTAQIPKKGTYDTKEYIASFAGFAPVEHPSLVVVVSIINPKKGGFYGGVVAAPVFADIMKFSLHYYAVKKDK